MRSIPNMTVLETGDATEVESICAAADSVDGPVYCRVLRGSVPRLFDSPVRVGEMRELASGSDVLIVTAGIATEEAMRAAPALERAGVSVRHLHLHTLKPFDAGRADRPCGLGAPRRRDAGEPRDRRAAWAPSWPRRWRRPDRAGGSCGSGLRDTFAHGGSRPYLMRHYELDALGARARGGAAARPRDGRRRGGSGGRADRGRALRRQGRGAMSGGRFLGKTDRGVEGDVNGDRFVVAYHILTADLGEARARAEAVALRANRGSAAGRRPARLRRGRDRGPGRDRGAIGRGASGAGLLRARGGGGCAAPAPQRHLRQLLDPARAEGGGVGAIGGDGRPLPRRALRDPTGCARGPARRGAG